MANNFAYVCITFYDSPNDNPGSPHDAPGDPNTVWKAYAAFDSSRVYFRKLFAD